MDTPTPVFSYIHAILDRQPETSFFISGTPDRFSTDQDWHRVPGSKYSPNHVSKHPEMRQKIEEAAPAFTAYLKANMGAVKAIFNALVSEMKLVPALNDTKRSYPFLVQTALVPTIADHFDGNPEMVKEFYAGLQTAENVLIDVFGGKAVIGCKSPAANYFVWAVNLRRF